MEIVVKYKTPANSIVEFICNGPKLINALLCSFSQEKAKSQIETSPQLWYDKIIDNSE